MAPLSAVAMNTMKDRRAIDHRVQAKACHRDEDEDIVDPSLTEMMQVSPEKKRPENPGEQREQRPPPRMLDGGGHEVKKTQAQNRHEDEAIHPTQELRVALNHRK